MPVFSQPQQDLAHSALGGVCSWETQELGVGVGVTAVTVTFHTSTPRRESLTQGTHVVRTPPLCQPAGGRH